MGLSYQRKVIEKKKTHREVTESLGSNMRPFDRVSIGVVGTSRPFSQLNQCNVTIAKGKLTEKNSKPIIVASAPPKE
jgi:hypothetical protein